MATMQNGQLVNMDYRLEAARLLDTDDPIGDHAWPLACYVSEAIENELDALSAREKRRPHDYRHRLSVRRAINNASVYADQWHIEPALLAAALETRRY